MMAKCWIARLDPDDSQLGEHGTGLCAGQKQRIAIAIVLLRQTNILIFDEAVSNLDPQTAEQFAKTINKLKGKVTIIFITHQLPRGLHVNEVVKLGNQANQIKETVQQSTTQD